MTCEVCKERYEKRTKGKRKNHQYRTNIIQQQPYSNPQSFFVLKTEALSENIPSQEEIIEEKEVATDSSTNNLKKETKTKKVSVRTRLMSNTVTSDQPYEALSIEQVDDRNFENNEHDSPSPNVKDGIPTTFAWTFGSKTGNVHLGCSWAEWKTEPMKKTPSSDCYTTRINVPLGTHRFQFVVDDVWRYSLALPTASTTIGTGTNFREIRAPPDEVDATSVKTQFVWLDDAKDSVQLCGAWTQWKPMPMRNVAPQQWTISTTVPVGTQHFRFVVDGIPTHSKRHPVVESSEKTLFNLVRVEGTVQEKESGEKKNEGRERKRSAGAGMSDTSAKSCCVIC